MTQYRFRLLSLSLLSLLIVLSPLARGFDFPPVPDEDMRFKEVPGHPGAPAAILYKEEIDDDAKNHSRTMYERIKILTEAGRKYADIQIPFEKGDFNIEGVSGRTIHADGSVVQFDGKVYDKEIVKARGYKVHVKSFSLPDVQVGSIIEYRYHVDYGDRVSYAPHWIIQSDLWVQKAYYKFMPYMGDLMMEHGQIGNGVAWISYLPSDSKPKQVPSRDSYYFEYTVTNVEPFVDEPYMPDTDQFKNYIRFYYRLPNVKQADFWKNEGKYWNKDVDKFMGKKNGISEQVQQLVAANDTPEQKAKKIYAFVQSLENESFRPPRSQQELKALGMKEVKGVDDVLAQKSGTRRQLTRLFVAMARAAGIPAYLMEITNREENYFSEMYLSSDQLDSEIALVTLNGKDVFVDPGTKFAPFGILDWRHTATKGIRQTASGTELADVPPPQYMESIIERLGKFEMKDNGMLEGTLKMSFVGQQAMSHRQSAIRTDAEGRKKDLEDEVRSWLPAEADVKLISQPNWDTVEGPLNAAFQISTPAASNAGHHVLLPVLLFQMNEKPKFPASQRVNGVYLYFPWLDVDLISVTLPANLSVENLPQNENVKLDWALYKTKWTQDKQTITVRRDLAVGGFAFPQKEYPEIKAFFDKSKTGDEQQAVLKVGANAAGN